MKHFAVNAQFFPVEWGEKSEETLGEGRGVLFYYFPFRFTLRESTYVSATMFKC
jgi:hypothetical protein